MVLEGQHRIDPPEAVATPVKINTREIERAETLGGAIYHPHRVEPKAEAGQFAMQLQASNFSNFTIGLLQYASPVEIRSMHPRPDFYQVNFPLTGRVRMSDGQLQHVLTNKLAIIQDWTTPTILTGWHEPAQILGLRIPRALVEHTATLMHDECPDDVVYFEPKLNLTSPPGLEWKSLVTTLAGVNVENQSALANPLVAAPLIDTIVRILISTQQTVGAEASAARSTATGPRTVQRAIEFMHASAHRPLSITEIAAATSTSTRSLQLGFERYAEAPPMTVLRQIRLQGARKMLLTTTRDTPIREVAAAWGFSNPGRFAVQFAKYFGTPPSQIPRQ